MGDHGRKLWNTTQESQVCKTCIDNGFVWCPTSTKVSGYCCELTENCPRAGGCSVDYQYLEFQYMLCPNEAGCKFDRVLDPPADGKQKMYENMDGVFRIGDVCSFKIQIPESTDLNDMMYVRVEYLSYATATLITGQTFDSPKIMYDMQAGRTYTATKNTNFYLLFQSTSQVSGQFVFTVWFKKIPGDGFEQPRKVTLEDAEKKNDAVVTTN